MSEPTREQLLATIFDTRVSAGELYIRPLCKTDVYNVLSAETAQQQNCPYCHRETSQAAKTVDNYCCVCGRKLRMRKLQRLKIKIKKRETLS